MLGLPITVVWLDSPSPHSILPYWLTHRLESQSPVLGCFARAEGISEMERKRINKRKTGHDFRRGLFFVTHRWVSHFVAPESTGYALSMGARCCRLVVGVVDLRYLPLDISGGGLVRGKKTKTNHEISWFTSLHTGGAPVLLLVSSAFVVVVSSLLFLLLIVVVSSLTSPFLPLLLLLIVVSSAGFAHRRRCRFGPCRCPGLPRRLPSPDSPSRETNPPTSLWKGEGRLGLQPRL